MVYRSRRRRKNFSVVALIFLLLTVVFALLFRFWKQEYYFVIAAILGLTGLIATGLAWFQRKNALMGVVAVGLLLTIGVYFLRDGEIYQSAVASFISEPGAVENGNDDGDEEVLSGNEGTIDLTIRVFDDESNAVQNAQVLVFAGGPPITQYTDSNGTVVFDTKESQIEARLVVKHAEYDVREEIISISTSGTKDIKLSRKDESEGMIIVRVVDNANGRSVDNATVSIIAEGNVFQDDSDDLGLARFRLDFPTGQLAVEMYISTEDYVTSSRSLTIRPNDVQNIRLNAENETIVAIEEVAAQETPTLVENPDPLVISASFSTNITPVDEEEPNDEAENAQVLDAIGMENPVQATIRAAANDGDPGDLDWYSFTAVAGQTYVIELYNVANNIDLVSRRYNCNGTSTLKGLRIIVFDPADNEINRVCAPNGFGNVHTVASFVAGVTGKYTIQVAAHAPQVSGDYSLRVLPKFDDDAAKWDQATFEPNNTLANAFTITPGYDNALTSVIEPRQASYSTSNGDIDIYRFSVISGQSYVVELFNVANNLTLRSRRYNCGEGTRDHTGLQAVIFDPSRNELTRQCTPNGVGNVHTILSFTAGASGDHYIRVLPHEGTVSGNYSIRVLPQHNQTGAGWEADTFEPNNQAMNAYELIVDAEAVRSRIEATSNVYSTTRSDKDWYRFEVISGNTYVVEILDIDNGIADSGLRYNCGDGNGTRTYTGFWLGVYDDTVTEISRQCIPNGSGNVHTALEFTASRSSTFYALLYPHDGEASGEYSVRVSQK
jgi:hypothetical protein